jgi:hypothetical protein
MQGPRPRTRTYERRRARRQRVGAALIGGLFILAALAGIGSFLADAGLWPFDGRSTPTPTRTADDSPTPTPAASSTSSQSQSSTPDPTTVITDTPVTPKPVLGFLERVAGGWTLESWTEAGGAVTLYIEVLNGTMTINPADQPDPGVASWRMDIQERAEPTTPQPAILCGGTTTLGGMIEGVPGGDRNGSFNWTADLQSIDHSTTGEGWIWRALCGWATIGTRAPFAVTLDGDPTLPANRMEMTNEYGTFRWSR